MNVLTRALSVLLRWLRFLLSSDPKMESPQPTADEVVRIAIRELGLTNELRWAARVEYRHGTAQEDESRSLGDLISRLPAFGSEHRSDDIRVKAEEGTNFIHGEELLELLQLNQGVRGLDLSGCKLWHVDLGRDHIQELRREFLRLNGYDPVWCALGSTRGLDLRGLLAEKTEFAYADLSGADLSGARLDWSLWNSANLSGAHFSRAKLNHCWFEDTNLRGAYLAGAELERADFSGGDPGKLDGATIYRARLVGATFNGVSLRGVTGFGERTDLRGVRLRGADLAGVSLDVLDPGALEGAYFYGATLGRTPMRRDLVGGLVGEELLADRLLRDPKAMSALPEAQIPVSEWLRRASEAYRGLKSNFADLGRTDDASWAHFNQRRALGRHYWRKWREEERWSLLWKVGLDRLFRVSAGYGEKPLRAFGTGLVVIVAFWLLFFAIGRWTGDTFLLRDSFIYSGGAFFAIGFSGLDAHCWVTQLLTLIEAAFGFVVLGLFLWSIGNTAGRS